MATLAAIRAALNGELGVIADAEAAPWSVAVRNQAISDGYAELWRVGVWKASKQDLSTVTDQHVYALTAIRRLGVLETLNSSSFLLSRPKGVVEDDGAGGYQLRLKAAIDSGVTLRVKGWTAYTSTFADDQAVDDLPAEHARVPRLKAKAILFRQQTALFMRYSSKRAAPPTLNVSFEQLLGAIAAAEREFADEAHALSDLRQRFGQPVGI